MLDQVGNPEDQSSHDAAQFSDTQGHTVITQEFNEIDLTVREMPPKDADQFINSTQPDKTVLDLGLMLSSLAYLSIN